MKPWSSLALLAVVLIKWISGAHGSRFFCFQPENYSICRILMEHNVAINKRFLRFGRNFGEPFLRFGRSNEPFLRFGRSGTGAAEEDDMNKRLSSFEDKAYLRFGRAGADEDMMSIFLRGPPQYRRKRSSGESAEVEDKVHSRRRRAVEEASPASADNLKRRVRNVDQELGHVEVKRQSQFPRFGRLVDWDNLNEDVGNYEKRLMRFGRNGWLHFGKRVLE